MNWSALSSGSIATKCTHTGSLCLPANLALVTEVPSRGLPAKIYLPIVLGIVILAAIPIASFLRTGLSTSGSAIGAVGSTLTPPPMIANALAELRGRIARNPKDTEALESLAGLELEAGRLTSAADLDAQAVAADPRNGTIRANYAEVLNDLGRSKEAQQQLDAALAVNPHNIDALYERGIVDERLGDHDQSANDFAAFLKYSSPNDPRRAALLGQSGQHS
jgi:cytochrome c-type biogenesis protein CcmH/NrfG